MFALLKVPVSEWQRLHRIVDSGAAWIGRLHPNRLDEVDGPYAMVSLFVVAGGLVR